MELIWEDPTAEKADGFDNTSNPYAHYWLEEHTDGQGPACVQVASCKPLNVADLVDRAFKR